jgi:hypothetical protein
MKQVLLAVLALLTIASLPKPAVALDDTLIMAEATFYGGNALSPKSPGSFLPRWGR